MPEVDYEVLIDATLGPGALTYGEAVIPGESSEEFLVSAHVCHPQMANDNQAGVALAIELACWLASAPRRWTYRFVFAPGTIGAIVWLSRNPAAVKRIRHGLVVACVGVRETFHYKQSRQGATEIDRAASYLLSASGRAHRILPFSPYGDDERQYGSPGFDLPVGSLRRTPSGGYPEAHTSADDPALVTADALDGSFVLYRDLIDMLESNRTFVNLAPYRGTSARAAGLVPRRWRTGRPWRQRTGAFVGAEPVGWTAHLAGHRRAIGRGSRVDRRGGTSSPRSRSPGRGATMKVVLFCGGLGTRLGGHFGDVPKPLVNVGARPILWHVMSYYAHFGHTEFVLCLGFRGEAIKRYFLGHDQGLADRLCRHRASYADRRTPQAGAALRR